MERNLYMEFWDIYDSNKQKTGRTMKRNDWCLKDDEYHLTVLGVIARPDGKFLITQRVMTKAWAPGWWEVSGGAAMAGEESEDAVKREIKEETSLDVLIDPTFRETVSYYPKRDTQKTVVYFIARARNYDFTPQAEEISDIRWVDIGYAASILSYENDKNIVSKAKAAIM